MKSKSTRILFFFLLLLFLPLLSSHPVIAKSLWELNDAERVVHCLYLENKGNEIIVENNNFITAYPLDDNVFIMLAGIRSGSITSLKNFPHNIPVEIILNKAGKVRAMQNKLLQYAAPNGIVLDCSGHTATISPNEKYYTVFSHSEGLSLHELEKTKKPLFLSSHHICTWNNKGTKIAFCGDTFLGVYDTDTNTRTLYPFSQKNNDLIKTITSLDWNPSNENLLCTYLEDYPQQGSSSFQMIVLNNTGKILASKIVENLGPSYWLSEEEILYIQNPCYDNTGQAIVWNYKTNKTYLLLETLNTPCYNLCYNRQHNSIIYTISKDQGEELYYISLTENMTLKIKYMLGFFPYPIRNLQWSQNSTIFYWEELTNTINEIDKHGNLLSKFSGFLPEKGVSLKFLYFLEEPIEKPLQLHLSPQL